jgi:hypothetical protein
MRTLGCFVAAARNVVSCALSILVVHQAAATTFGEGSEVPMMYAIKEICDTKYPEFQSRNENALASWRRRNLKAVAEAEALPSFQRSKEQLVVHFETTVTSEQWAKTCQDLATELTKPEYDVKERSSK